MSVNVYLAISRPKLMETPFRYVLHITICSSLNQQQLPPKNSAVGACVVTIQIFLSLVVTQQ